MTTRLKPSDISDHHLVINGRAYSLYHSSHPKAEGIEAGSNVLDPPIGAGGKDATLLFQNVNGNCKGLIKPKPNCTIPHTQDELAWYMPCKLIDINGTSKPDFSSTKYNGYACHTSAKARKAFYNLDIEGEIHYNWETITRGNRTLVVYNGYVLDMDMLMWLQTDDLEYPPLFDKLRSDPTLKGHDLSVLLTDPVERQVANCLIEIVKVGVVDVDTIGCISATIVLYVSLVFVLSIVMSKFFVACYFKWCVARKQGAFVTSLKQAAQRDRSIEEWVDDPNSKAPITTVPVKRRANYHSKSTNRKHLRLKWGGEVAGFIDDDSKTVSERDYKPQYLTMTTEAFMLTQRSKKSNRSSIKQPLQDYWGVDLDFQITTALETAEDRDIHTLGTDLIVPNVISQSPVPWEPFGYPLVHTMCLVTCYSEDEDGIRTTLDSLATTDYPNSHKLIVVICDGLITGAGNQKSTPDICLDLMTDFVVPKDEVKPYSYVSVAQGAKRHNMAKVYAGFYKYDESTVPAEKQQKTPILLIVKCGTPQEAKQPKPGNRGKRDSQIILMSFLQKVTFNDRMTELEFEIMRAIWQVTGLMATMYEVVLMVDADTLVYPDSITHMNAEMVKNPDVMGLCGETKISNKAQSWVTAIQVFEYYISHHQSKAFESVFGTVTCLPGCFCMYRIKTPKDLNVWVPILANSDIVEKYSENVLDSLHKKNLLLLGEDRYLSSLMLRTFPTRKQIFVPKAACKTIVPDNFSVLLSQRRRWINSTVHNLMELVLVKDLCGTFCFSMNFIIAVELVGTLVLPASITFTFYIIITSFVSTPKPVMSLILMAIIFGLPGVLIIVTISDLMYIVWMMIYFISLPIWNFVLPAYAFWKFDDFSWGDTRKLQGGDKDAHENKAGEFDGSSIVQMTWRDYERIRLGIGAKHTIPTVYNPGQLQETFREQNSSNMLFPDVSTLDYSETPQATTTKTYCSYQTAFSN
uniref:chitin synthase n=1 Tax=Ogataea thermomethanolica (nom. inval.) TaxID=310468 RepID=A0A7R6ZTD2_9ASCO|nr:chitin synthase D [Ogataea thermomethanolica (nom. inval.)]